MIGLKRAVSLFAGLVMLAGYATNASAADATAEDAVRAVNQAWVKAYNAGDAATAAGLYADNAVLMPPGAGAVKGAAAIKTFLANDMAGSAKAGVTFAIGAKPDVGISGDMAWESGTYTAKLKSGATADAGKYLGVYKKTDGKWKLIRDTWNSDGSPAPEPAAPAKPAAPAAPPKK